MVKNGDYFSRSIGPLLPGTAGVSPASVECHIVRVERFDRELSGLVA